LKKIKEREN